MESVNDLVPLYRSRRAYGNRIRNSVPVHTHRVSTAFRDMAVMVKENLLSDATVDAVNDVSVKGAGFESDMNAGS